MYWQDNACADQGFRAPKYGHDFRVCLNAVAITESGTLEVLGFWSGRAAVRPAEDVYLKDDRGHRYDLILARGAAATGAHLTASSPARGAFVFPSPPEGTTRFKLHDEQNALVIPIELDASSRSDRTTSARVLATVPTTQSVTIKNSLTAGEDFGYDRKYFLSLGPDEAKGHYLGEDGGYIRETTRIEVSRESIDAFLDTLMRAPLLEREYVATWSHTHDDPYYEIRLVGEGETIVFFTSSQGGGNVPWAARVGEKTYVIPTDTPMRALALLQAHLPNLHVTLSQASPDPYVQPSGEEKALWNPPPPRFAELVDAAESGDVARVRALLAAAADVDEVCYYDDETPLLIASRNGHTDVVHMLLQAGARFDARGVSNSSALGYAAASGNLDIVRSLIEAGEDVNSTAGQYGDTALIGASEGGHIDVVRFLLAAKADVNARSTRVGRTALACAAARGHPEIVRLLLNSGADVHARDLDGETAILRTGNANVIRLLVDAGANIDSKTSSGMTVLMRLARYSSRDDAESDRIPVLETVLDLGANVHARDPDQRTALMWVCAKGRNDIANDIVELLLRAGARVDDEDEEGQTALFYAAGLTGLGRMYNSDAVRLLIEAGADSFHENKNGASVLFLADQKRREAILEILNQRPGRPLQDR